MITRAEIQLLLALGNTPSSYQDLTRETDLSSSTVSRRISRLEELGLVDTIRDGREKTAERQTTGVATSLDWVSSSIPHISLSSFLTPPRLRVLWFLNTERIPEEIEPFLSVGHERVRQLLMDLRKRQLATRTDTGTRLREGYTSLQSLSRQLFAHYHREDVRREFPRSNTVWTAPEESLLGLSRDTSMDSVLENSQLAVTGLHACERWNLKFRPSSPPLVYRTTVESQSKLSVEAVVAHILRRQMDNRRIQYAVLLLARAGAEGSFDINQFEKLIEHYGVSTVGRCLLPLVVLAGGAENQPQKIGDDAGDPVKSVELTLSETSLDPKRAAEPRITDQFPSIGRVRHAAAQYEVDINSAALHYRQYISNALLSYTKSNLSE